MKEFRWGIFGTGAISAKFVAGLRAAKFAKAVFIASRTQQSAVRFATEFKIPRAIVGYEEAAREGGVDAIYIATPPSDHATHAKLCIEFGIPVLVEKPFATNKTDANSVMLASRDRSVFAMEAMWTRFLPAAQALHQQVAAGTVGRPRFLTANFGSSQSPDERNGMFDPQRGGGATLHLGAYPLSLGQWLFGDPVMVHATGTMSTSGVDEDAAFLIHYKGGVISVSHVSLRSWAPDSFQVLGEHGMIGFEGSIVRPYGLRISQEKPLGWSSKQFGLLARLQQNAVIHRIAQLTGQSARDKSRASSFHYNGNGYHYEADEVRSCVETGRIESHVMPLSDSLAVVSTMDEIRAQIVSAGLITGAR